MIQHAAPMSHVSARERTSSNTWLNATISGRGSRMSRAVQDTYRLALGAPWPDRHGLVFTSQAGAPTDPRSFKAFDRRCEQAGVRRIRVHDTRHTCGSLLAAMEVHPRVAMQILRHSKIDTTMEIYTHVPSEITRRRSGS
jgi:integrase